MASLLIRDLDAATVAAIDAHASAAGQSREAWLRRHLGTLDAAPIIRAAYRLRGLGVERPGVDPASVLLRRGPEGLVTGHARDCDDAQMRAYRDAHLLVEANGPGARERAIGILQAAGFEVYEAP